MMPLPSSLLEQSKTQNWLKQFSMGDQELAVNLLKHFVLVSRDEFVDGLRALVLDAAKNTDRPIGLYAERELRHFKYVPNRLFKEPRRKIKRAEGVGPLPVSPTRRYDPAVGSEGLVAHLISQLCKEYKELFLNHPGPAEIRKSKVREFWVLTDLIGSGERARTYLEAAWRVCSVRSWASGQFMKFKILAYSGTTTGEALVRAHRSRPTVLSLVPCPTIHESFSSIEARMVVKLCEVYDPSPVRSRNFLGPESLGYRNTGALIAFAHGAPNNVPNIFHKAGLGKNGWIPLFPARVTADVASASFGRLLDFNEIERRLHNIGQTVLAKAAIRKGANIKTNMLMLILAALSRPPRLVRPIAARTGLTTLEVRKLLGDVFEIGWIDTKNRLTDAGYAQLAYARRQVAKSLHTAKIATPLQEKAPYYPQSLRAPILFT